MDKDRIKGTVEQAKGAARENLGKLTGNDKLEAEGRIEKAGGSIRKSFGKAKDALRKS